MFGNKVETSLEPQNLTETEVSSEHEASPGVEEASALEAAPETEPAPEQVSVEKVIVEEEPASSQEPTRIVEDTESPAKRNWFGRLKQGLTKSSTRLSEGITGIFTKRKLDEDTLQELEDILIQADLGVDTAMRITDKLAQTRLDKDISTHEVQDVLASEVESVLGPVAQPLQIDQAAKPFVILMAGVNGAGKTTTIGKLSRKFGGEGKKVMLAAGDTFRAAAVEQLEVWGKRTGAPVVKREIGSDAASLAYDAMSEAKAACVDVLMMDTAGRLQNKVHLMDELIKIVRVMKKLDASAPHAVLLVLDATTGQNALNQTKVFGEAVDVTGLVMTKLDGSARGGILVAIADRFKLPVHFIGVGEGVEDLQPFKAEEFAKAIAQI
ncbi:MAG: signal recognition particle-docking protein FtsY [bacterium]|nr:signal recognition particle-docking protein FtsY [bacterium]